MSTHEMDFMAAQEVLSNHFPLEVLEALDVCVRGVARAIFHDETEKAEAERRQKLDDLKRSIGVPVFADPATSPTDTGAGEAADADAGAKSLAEWFRYSWDGIPDRDISDRFPDFTEVPKFQGGKPALRKMAARITRPFVEHIADLEQRLAEAETFSAYNRRQAETAEAALAEKERRIGELATELQFIDNLVADNIRENGGDQHRMLVKGEWHSGPAVDACHRMLRGIQKIARAALDQPKGDDA